MVAYYRNDPDPVWERLQTKNKALADGLREYALTEYNSSLTGFCEELDLDLNDEDFFLMRDAEGRSPKDILDEISAECQSERRQRYSNYYLDKVIH